MTDRLPELAEQSGKDMRIWFDAGGPVGESYVTVADEFITCTELGIIPVSFAPWDKPTH